MTKQQVIDFFNKCAPTWDAEMIRSDKIISQILDNARVKSGCEILDVACGTGVLFPDYLKRNIKSLTGIDISPEMIKISKEKFKGEPKITLICDDAETYTFTNQFDTVIVYNAFPHFENPEKLINALASVVKKGGVLSIAHGMSREKIMMHHSGSAKDVSVELLPAKELKKIMEPLFDVYLTISDDSMYQVCGIKK